MESTLFDQQRNVRDGRRVPELWAAPMAGISDAVFRELCVEYGADLAFSEMVSAKGLSYDNAKTWEMCVPGANERRFVVQLFGREPGIIAREAACLQEKHGDVLAAIDINMGCPVKKVVSKGEGSALMRDPDTAVSIVRETVSAVGIPVTVKIRRGWDIGDEAAPTFAKALEDAGAAAITVHGRFAKQYYHGDADWGVISRVKQAVSIPVVGNGDVKTPLDVVRMHETTVCDAIMIGRGAIGHPWIFAHAKECLETGRCPAEPTMLARIAIAKTHCERLNEQGGSSLVRMRTIAMRYVAGMPGATDARRAFSECTTLEDFLSVFDGLAAAEDTEE